MSKKKYGTVVVSYGENFVIIFLTNKWLLFIFWEVANLNPFKKAGKILPSQGKGRVNKREFFSN